MLKRFAFVVSLPSIYSSACMVYTDSNTCVVLVILILAAIIQSSEFAKNACENLYVFLYALHVSSLIL
jgi:hypothetical protein